MTDVLAVMITVIIIAVPVAGIVGFILWVLSRRRGESASMSEDELREHKARRHAEREHAGRVRSARKELSSAEGMHAKQIRAAARALDGARSTPKLAAVWATGATRFVLFEDRLQAPDGTHPLHPEITASVDAAGNMAVKSRSTLTRMGVGTVVAGPFGLVAGAAARKSKKIDTRELYLLVDGGVWATMGKFNPDKGAAVRAFAQAVMVAARNAPAAAQRRAELVARCEQTAARVQADRGEIDRTTAALRTVEGSAPQPPHITPA
jgi:hypothetical protein